MSNDPLKDYKPTRFNQKPSTSDPRDYPTRRKFTREKMSDPSRSAQRTPWQPQPK